MARAMLGGWVVGGVLLLLAGCASSDFLFFAGANSNGQRVVAGRMDLVAASTKTSLEKMGLSVRLTNMGDSVSLQGITVTGNHVTVLLRREQTAQGGEQTKVHVEWTGTRDEQTHVRIMAHFDSQPK